MDWHGGLEQRLTNPPVSPVSRQINDEAVPGRTNPGAASLFMHKVKTNIPLHIYIEKHTCTATP